MSYETFTEQELTASIGPGAWAVHRLTPLGTDVVGMYQDGFGYVDADAADDDLLFTPLDDE